MQQCVQEVSEIHFVSVMASSMTGLMMSASAMAVRSGLHAPGNPAGIVGMAAHIRATWQAAGMIPMSVVSSVWIAVLAIVHVRCSFGTARNIAYAVAVLTGQRTAVESAGSVNMRVFQAAIWQAAGMIPMSVVSSVRIAVYTVVHMGSSLGTARDIASVMAVFTGQCTAVDSAGTVNMCLLQAAAGEPTGMIPMSVVSSVRIAVYTVVHMGSSLGTVRDIAPVMAVLTGQRTAVDSAKAVLVLLHLCIFRNHAGNTYLTFRCGILRFQGTFIDRIRDNTASYHGNRNKRNG